MSGGGSSSKKKTEDKKAEPTVPGSGPMMTQQPFMPGMDTALAQQLAAGYGGNPADFLAMFQQTYAPMQVLDTRPGATSGGTSGTTGGTSGGTSGGGAEDGWMVVKNTPNGEPFFRWRPWGGGNGSNPY
jgi:hypothetical protein